MESGKGSNIAFPPFLKNIISSFLQNTACFYSLTGQSTAQKKELNYSYLLERFLPPIHNVLCMVHIKPLKTLHPFAVAFLSFRRGSRGFSPHLLPLLN